MSKNNNVAIITEDISFPIDEGIKKYSFQLAKYYLSQNINNIIYSASTNKDIPSIKPLPKNKILFSIAFLRKIRAQKPKQLIYIPSASSTLMSFLRLKILSLFSGADKVVMVSVQDRAHFEISKRLISFLKPNQIIVLSNKQAVYYSNLGIQCKVSPIGVDTKKFLAVSLDEKILIRKKYGLPLNSKILLHVGHINKGRNIGVLKALLCEGYTILIIGSTRFNDDVEYKAGLEKDGFIFINHFIENIQEYYQASDYYVFPVKSSTSAMEFPLSVLEAMACNLPIITTRFGGLETYLSESIWFKYFSESSELPSLINSFPHQTQCDNRSKVIKEFTWEKVFDSTFNKD